MLKTIGERSEVSEKQKIKIKKYLKDNDVSFLKELSDISTNFEGVGRQGLFLCYLLYEADLPVRQIPADMTLSFNRVREVKCDTLAEINKKISFD